MAAKKEKIADYKAHRAGRRRRGRGRGRFALQNAYEVNYGIETAHVVGLLNAAPAHEINIIQALSRLHARRLDRR